MASFSSSVGSKSSNTMPNSPLSEKKEVSSKLYSSRIRYLPNESLSPSPSNPATTALESPVSGGEPVSSLESVTRPSMSNSQYNFLATHMRLRLHQAKLERERLVFTGFGPFQVRTKRRLPSPETERVPSSDPSPSHIRFGGQDFVTGDVKKLQNKCSQDREEEVLPQQSNLDYSVRPWPFFRCRSINISVGEKQPIVEGRNSFMELETNTSRGKSREFDSDATHRRSTDGASGSSSTVSDSLLIRHNTFVHQLKNMSHAGTPREAISFWNLEKSKRRKIISSVILSSDGGRNFGRERSADDPGKKI